MSAKKQWNVKCGCLPGSLPLGLLQTGIVVEENTRCAGHVVGQYGTTRAHRHGGSLCRGLSYHVSARSGVVSFAWGGGRG